MDGVPYTKATEALPISLTFSGIILTSYFFGPGNVSPMATNVVLVVVVVVVVVVVGVFCCYQIFKSLKLLHFSTDRN